MLSATRALTRTSAQHLMKFASWDGNILSTQWLWSEKLDGIRASHTRGSGALHSRNGSRLAAPEEFMQVLEDFNSHLTRALQGLRGHKRTKLTIALDGELWGGRERFQDLVSAVKTTRVLNPPQERWQFKTGLKHAHAEELLQQGEILEAECDRLDAIHFLAPQAHSRRSRGGGHWGVYFMVFDWLCPGAAVKSSDPVTSMPFGERYEMLREAHASFVAERGRCPVKIVDHLPCGKLSERALSSPLDLQVGLLWHPHLSPLGSQKGNAPEGLMLRGPDGRYAQGERSPQVLKVKHHQEYECICVGVAEGEGKFEGVVGALVCEMVGRDGEMRRFSCGSGLTDDDRLTLRRAKRKYVGRALTIRCNGYTDAGIPRFPRFIRWRSDRDPGELLLFGSGMQVDLQPRTINCRVSSCEVEGVNGRGTLELVVDGGESTGRTFRVGERSLPPLLKASLPLAQADWRVTVQLFGSADTFSCPLVTGWVQALGTDEHPDGVTATSGGEQAAAAAPDPACGAEQKPEAPEAGAVPSLAVREELAATGRLTDAAAVAPDPPEASASRSTPLAPVAAEVAPSAAEVAP
eukprot:Hpha_TRINITY_DN15029_c5_g1::TRINITY_DN15029_c5_g1_i1::g.125509::m.125509/K10747/LIG1; DNA ligase 1